MTTARYVDLAGSGLGGGSKPTPRPKFSVTSVWGSSSTSGGLNPPPHPTPHQIERCAWVGSTNVTDVRQTDRQTDDRLTDDDILRSRSLKIHTVRNKCKREKNKTEKKQNKFNTKIYEQHTVYDGRAYLIMLWHSTTLKVVNWLLIFLLVLIRTVSYILLTGSVLTLSLRIC